MEHIKLFWAKLNIPTLLGACQANLHWSEAVFLYSHHDQFDQAIEVLIQHSAVCWEHKLFKEVLGQVANTEYYYRAIDFYVNEHPLELSDLLLDMATKLDHSRVVQKIRAVNHIPLIFKYLLHVQRENILMVNEAINEVYLDEEKYQGLRESIDHYSQFDQLALARRCEGHQLLEFRRISAYLYKQNRKWERSIELSKKDGLWGDAMECTAQSADANLAEALLRFFVESGEKQCFAACLFTCYELIKPDLVLELAWRNDLMNFAMPYMIQAFRDFDDRLTGVQKQLVTKDIKEKEKDEEERKASEEAAVGAGFVGGGYNPLLAPLALPPPGFGMGMGMGMGMAPMMGMGMGMGGMF
jgi:clathrin heavy chain